MLTAADRAAIEQLHAAWLSAELHGDPAALLDLCTAAPVWLPPGEPPLCGRASILDWLDGHPPAALLRVDIDGVTISGAGPFGCKVAGFRTTFEEPAGGGARTISGTHVWLLRRDDAGAWRIAVVSWTID